MKKTCPMALAFIVLMVGCVPLTQFDEVKKNNEDLEHAVDSLGVANEKISVLNRELTSKLDVAQKKLERLESNDITGSMEYIQLKENYDLLQKQLGQLKTSQQYLLENSAEETTKILSELQKTQEELQQKEDRLNRMELDLNRKKANLEKMTSELEANNRQLMELEKILFAKDSIVSALKTKISKALLGFENEGLTITQKNGKVYVSLDEKLLFKTGSREVDANGKAALRKLAQVLEQNPDIDIMVEGHTDDVPYIPGAEIKDNWDLSVLRATSIVKILLEGKRIDPKRLIASGRGEHMPLSAGKSADARQKNRRTEIILYPKLDELFNLIE
jgi:chemotaxis protein MotB